MIEIRTKPPNDLILSFEYDIEIIKKVRTITGRKWDNSNRYWIVPNNIETIDRINNLFSSSDIIDNTQLALFKKQLRAKPWEKQILIKLSDQLKLKGYSSKTIKAYVGHIRRFVDYNDDDPLVLNKKDIDKYLLYLLDDHSCSHSYVSQAISAIKILYNEVYRRNIICSDITRPKKEKKLPEILDKSEVAKLFEAVTNIKHKALMYMIYSSGLRVGEVVRLKATDVDSSRMLLHIVQSKGRKDRYTMLSETALKTLKEYVKTYKPDFWLFPGQQADKHLTERTVQQVFDAARSTAGIKKNVSVHSLRHYVERYIMVSVLLKVA